MVDAIGSMIGQGVDPSTAIHVGSQINAQQMAQETADFVRLHQMRQASPQMPSNGLPVDFSDVPHEKTWPKVVGLIIGLVLGLIVMTPFILWIFMRLFMDSIRIFQ